MRIRRISPSIRKILTVSMAMAMAMAISGGCTNDDPAPVTGFTPYSITLTAHNTTVEEVTLALAEYIHGVDDTGRGLPADWVVAGGDQLEAEEGPEHATLKLPGGTRLVEVCNHEYAAQAMSFGGHHAVALPCEIAVTQEGSDVNVVLLNPEAIFTLFFQDVPAEYAEDMGGLAATVRQELEDLVILALADFDVDIRREDVGTRYDLAQAAELSQMGYAMTADMDIPAEYLGSDDDKAAFKALFVETMLETLTHEGMDEVGSTVEGLTVDDWRSARKIALGLPGGVGVVEMCSPTYAAAAMSTGPVHAPALPCQIAIWVEGDTLRIDALDPQYIFGVFFADAPAEMMEEMGGLVKAVQDDMMLVIEATKAALAPIED